MTTTPDLEALGTLLRETAETEIMPRLGRVAASGKADGSIVTAADLAAQDRVRAALAAAYPDIPLLAEEMSADVQEGVLRQSRRGAWCLDPLDGTSNFSSIRPHGARRKRPSPEFPIDPEPHLCAPAHRSVRDSLSFMVK